VHLSSRYGDGKDGRGSEADKPTPTVTGTNHSHAVAANIVHYYGGADHASKTDAPLPTVTTLPRHYLTESHLCVLRRNTDCKRVDEPLATLTTSAGHFAQVVTYIQKLDSAQDLQNWGKVRELLNKYAGYDIADDEILILEINGIQHFVADIGMRMLKARELKLAQGFPPDYIIDIEPHIGKKYSEAKQIARLGNAVCPPVATALIRANCADMAYKKPLQTVAELKAAMEG
jgi:DNA (cytosine-5)-methyltransferase 1